MQLSKLSTRLSLGLIPTMLSFFVYFFQGNPDFIEGAALKAYAKEEDDCFPQEADVESFIKAADLDSDNKIGE